MSVQRRVQVTEQSPRPKRSVDAPVECDDPLGLEAAEMRELGYWVVDRVVDHFVHVVEDPAIRVSAPNDLRAQLGGPPPKEGGDPRQAMKTLVEVALANMQHGDHPRYFARVPGPSSFAGVLADWLGTGFNAIASSWSGGSGPATIELVTLDWLRQLLGMPTGTEGVMTSGGSQANMTALAAARVAVGPGVCYLSDQAHASIARALAVLGFPTDHIRVLASDRRLRLPLDTLAAAVGKDRAAGKRPGFVVATAGTTNTGAVDPLPELAQLCRSEGLWFHIDGAYGASAALCEAGRRVLAGLEQSDSLVLDPHKWLFQPYDLGCVFVRRPGILRQAFQMTPEYLVDVTGEEGEVNLRDRGLELTRRARGMKLWLTFRVYGLRRLAAAIEHGITLAEHAQRLIERDDLWEVVTPAQLGIITFARRGADHEEHQSLAAAVARDGFAVLTSTCLHGRSVLRLCTINPRTTTADIAQTLERLGIHPEAIR
jgi:aromatic-L-amino-acid/L-tryptophan decarboxylase